LKKLQRKKQLQHNTKLSGTKLTGQTIDCLNLINLKEKRRAEITQINRVLLVRLVQQTKIKGKNCAKTWYS
jgi:hypothetical protein